MLALAAPSARAGAINVWACHQPNGQTAPMDRWTSNITWAGIDANNSCASGASGTFGINVWAQPHPMHTYGTWKFTAPAGTSVTAFSYRRAWQVNGRSSFQSFRGVSPIYDSAHLMDLCQSANGCHTMAFQTRAFGLGNEAGVLLLLEACGPGGDCDGNSNGWVNVSSASVTLEDSDPPTFSSLGGGLTSSNPIRGSASMTLQAADVGTGLYKLHATIDGTSFDDRVVDTNSGKCQPVSGPRDFLYAVPCRTSVSASTTLNTATLQDGTHVLDVQLEDASGNLTTLFHDNVTTHNAPVMSTRPAILGTTKIGEELNASTGTWSSPSTATYAYEWLRCPSSTASAADVDACSLIAGATGAQYTPSTADVYRRLMVRVTATNGSGSASAPSAPSDLVADAQGRTSPPPPSDGGSRDVVIVPVAPGGSSSSSSTTTIINPPAGSSPIEGLKNPIAGPGHHPNGTNASEGGRGRIWLTVKVRGKRKRVSSVRSTRNRRWAIDGRLLNGAGQPIGGGKLVTAWQTNGRWVAHTGVVTRANGRFRYWLPSGPTRRIKFVYFAFSDSTSYSESNAVAVKVKTPVKLRAPRAARNNGRAVEFTGSVAADFVPKRGVLVRLQGRAPGDRWKDVRTGRARSDGRFVIKYRFTSTSARTLYRFRVVVAKQAGYPYEGGISPTTTVLVTP